MSLESLKPISNFTGSQLLRICKAIFLPEARVSRVLRKSSLAGMTDWVLRYLRLLSKANFTAQQNLTTQTRFNAGFMISWVNTVIDSNIHEPPAISQFYWLFDNYSVHL